VNEVTKVVRHLAKFRFQATTEAEFQNSIAEALGREFTFRREVRLAPGDRIDFLLDNGVGIEVKTQGTAATAEKQLRRYAKSEQVKALILMTSRSQVAVQPLSIDGKPVRTVIFYGGLM